MDSAVEDLGDPISSLAIPDGLPVYDRDGERVGVVDRIQIDETGIFQGIVIHAHPVVPGRHLYADHGQLAEVRERGILLAVRRDELDEPVPRRRSADEPAPERPLEAAVRRAWDWLSGAR